MTLYLVRGLPGSGKSTYALKSLEQFSINKPMIFEADAFFEDMGGNYNFKRELLGAAHDMCYGMTADSLNRGEVVIVANTFTQEFELKRYIKLAQLIGVECHIIECQGKWKSVHDVPYAVMESMKARWMPQEQVMEKFGELVTSYTIVNQGE